MSSKRYAFASSLWSFVPGILVILFFAISDINLYKTVPEANQGYEFLFFIAPIILVVLLVYHTVMGFIQNKLKRPKLIVAVFASIFAALPFPLLVAFSKSGSGSEERLAIVLTAALIFAIFGFSLFAGSLYQFLKIKGGLKNGT